MSKSIEAVIDQVIIQPSKIQPIIVNFQNGALKDEETSRMKCGVYHDTKEGKTVLAMSNGQLVYKGYRPDHEKELTYTMLAIHSRRTGKIRLIQAERWDVAPVLDKQVEVKEDLSTADKIGALSKQFGSKKSKRRTEQHERMKVNIDASKEQLEKTVSNVVIDREDLRIKSLSEDNGISEHLPHCNREAKTSEDLYNLYDIIPKDVLESVYEKIDEILEDGNERKSQFYIQTLDRVKLGPQMTEKVAILEYMEAIRTWFTLPIRELKKRVLDMYPYSTQFNDYVIETYSVQGANGRLRPNTMKDKCIIHCMIMALMISNFKVDIELFMTLFGNSRGGVKKFTALARTIGAVPMKDNKKMFVLKVPLPPPVSAVRQARRTTR